VKRLEETVVKQVEMGREVDLEYGLLVISGLTRDEQFAEYEEKIGAVQQNFQRKLARRWPTAQPNRESSQIARTRLLFDYLWLSKPKRCNDSYLLTHVVDAQLDSNLQVTVGSCVGLTSLFTVLACREGLELTVMVSDSHIMNRLSVDNSVINIDNTDPLGFNCLIDTDRFREFPAIGLLACVINSRGYAKEKAGQLEAAMEDYNLAIRLNPEYAKPYNNRGSIKFKQIDYLGAIQDYELAIGLDPCFADAYYNRGLARAKLQDFQGARADLHRAVELDPDNEDAIQGREIIKRLSKAVTAPDQVY